MTETPKYKDIYNAYKILKLLLEIRLEKLEKNKEKPGKKTDYVKSQIIPKLIDIFEKGTGKKATANSKDKTAKNPHHYSGKFYSFLCDINILLKNLSKNQYNNTINLSIGPPSSIGKFAKTYKRSKKDQ